MRGRLIGDDLLKRAFREFDKTGKGYITEADLARVLGASVSGEEQASLGQWLRGAAGDDREGRRLTYGAYLELMTNVLKQTVKPGECVYTGYCPCAMCMVARCATCCRASSRATMHAHALISRLACMRACISRRPLQVHLHARRPGGLLLLHPLGLCRARAHD